MTGSFEIVQDITEQRKADLIKAKEEAEAVKPFFH